MSYSVRLSRRAANELAKLPREIVRRADEQILSLAEDPRPPGSKKLRSKTSEGWRVRIGAYRVLYQIDDDRREITVYRIAHRRDVYD